MYTPVNKLSTPKDFNFPYNPYSIQQQLMEAVYKILEEKGVGILESPTGTGKTLTLMCAALRWLEDHEALMRREIRERIADIEIEVDLMKEVLSKSSDWLTTQYLITQKVESLNELRNIWKLLQEYDSGISEIHRRKSNSESLKCKNVDSADTDRYTQLKCADNYIESSSNSEKFSESSYRSTKIYYCSRTHSQLSQAVRELKRTAYGRRIRCISLASRQQLCIHSEVRNLPHVTLMNERCHELTTANYKSSTPKVNTSVKAAPLKSCPFKTSQLLRKLSDNILVDILDIEELISEGEATRACPYYATRTSIRTAQLVMLPYQMLLHQRTRQQTGIDLRGAIIIIDEAHNLLDTIAQIHSCEISLKQLLQLQTQLNSYKFHYAKRFNPSNMLRVNQLIFILKRLIKLLQPNTDSCSKSKWYLLHIYELLSKGEFFNINLLDLIRFCEKTCFAQKLQGFVQNNQFKKLLEKQVPTTTKLTVDILQRLQTGHRDLKLKDNDKSLQSNVCTCQQNTRGEPISTPIRIVLTFIETLTENSEDGRVLITTDEEAGKSCSLKYILLNPGGHFEDIIHEARSIIIAGGTMQPMTELTDQLFRSCTERVQCHSYDHIVPSNAVLSFAIGSGSTGRRLCFNYIQRNQPAMLTELVMFLQNICSVVPEGVICFLPSYDYLDIVYLYLEQSAVLARISEKKTVFREPKLLQTGQSIDGFLTDYAVAIKCKQKGALLLSVVGGKLSEGLNFADELCRAVIVVGLPYPNRQSPELQERIRYLDETLSFGAGNEYYENLCIKSVNQCVGRSVRHIRDYACVYLLDERYASDRIQKKLPQWILRSLQIPTAFGQIQSATAQFFKYKRC